jgi:hypothetical protein
MAIAVFIDLVNRKTGELAHFEGEGPEASNDAMVSARAKAREWMEWFTPDDFPSPEESELT